MQSDDQNNMKIPCTLKATLYLGKLSRNATGFANLREPDNKWAEFQNLKSSFLKKHPDLKDSLEAFMKQEKQKWGNLFGDAFKRHSLATFVMENVSELQYEY